MAESRSYDEVLRGAIAHCHEDLERRRNGIMAGYHIDVTCPACGHDLRHVADGRPQDNGQRTTAIATCSNCPRKWVIEVRLGLVGPSFAANTRHRNQGTAKAYAS